MNLFQTLPSLGSAHGCFQRIDDFLRLEERIDYREPFETAPPITPDAASPMSHEYALSLQNLSLGWNVDSPVLSDINFHVRKGTSIAIVGPIGSGKSLLLKGLIGEAHKLGGQLTLAPSASFAYCSQTAWLENVSAQQNMTQYGTEASNSDFYRQLTIDCVLDDLVGLSTFATGSVGSGGVMLSGGQRQRLVSSSCIGNYYISLTARCRHLPVHCL
jgi:ABC-type bacteriocin/lantibiotic exporter with double-glycine peptidase domain